MKGKKRSFINRFQDYFGFVSYSHIDKKYLQELKTVLAPLTDIDIFYDFKIEIGSHWDGAIQEAAQGCKAGILLLSPYFLDSPYTILELKVLKDLAAKNRCKLYILCLAKCQYQAVGLDQFQFVNPPSEALYDCRKGKRFAIYNKLADALRKQYFED